MKHMWVSNDKKADIYDLSVDQDFLHSFAKWNKNN